MALRFRPMTLRDFPASLALWKVSPGVAVDVGDDRASLARFLRRNRGLSVVACDGPLLVGALLAGHDGRRGYLYHLAVARSHQHCGIASELVQRSLTTLQRAGLPRAVILVERSNRRGLRFWKRRRWDGLNSVLAMVQDL